MLGYDVDRIYEAILDLRRAGQAAMLVTVADKQGSAPALPGTKMLVYADGQTLGTVGGGALERLANTKALELLGQRQSLLVHYTLTEQGQLTDSEPTGMVCGGRAALLYEYLGHGMRVCIFGAGHVGKTLVDCLKRLPCYTIVVDPRPELIAQVEGANRLVTCEYAAAFQNEPVPTGAFYVIATPGHEMDYEVLKRTLSADWAPRYVGLVASKRKATVFMQRLREELGNNLDLCALYTPVGLDLGGSTPEEIAISITAEIMALQYDKLGHKHLRLKW
jgi:xanthine dehydrogenase accessory factor